MACIAHLTDTCRIKKRVMSETIAPGGKNSIAHRLYHAEARFLQRYSRKAPENSFQTRRSQRRFTHEKLRNVPVERFLLTLAIGQNLKRTFPNEY